jgi:DNA (cytosine-5)-methyltransferase 1
MTHGSLFSGIGGFDLAAEWMGWENLFHCEYDPWNRKILNHYWKKAKSYEDIRKTDFSIWRGKIDILTGGFPCQPFSTAGKRKGTEDDRHLWPEMLRAIQEIAPIWIVGENVRGIVNWSEGLVFEQVCADLEAEGYEVQAFILPAAAVNAPHRRDRVWFVAYSDKNHDRNITEQNREKNRLPKKYRSAICPGESIRTDEIFGFVADADKKLHECWNGQGKKRRNIEKVRAKPLIQPGNWEKFPIEPPICGGDDGIPTELDNLTIPKWRKQSLMAYGNAIVPQVAYQIFQSIEQYNQLK